MHLIVNYGIRIAVQFVVTFINLSFLFEYIHDTFHLHR